MKDGKKKKERKKEEGLFKKKVKKIKNKKMYQDSNVCSLSYQCNCGAK